MYLFASELCLQCMQLIPATKTTDINTASCGTVMGCHLEPLSCIYALDTCAYVLTWHVEHTSVRFQLTAKVRHRVLWTAMGLNDEPHMVSRCVICLFVLCVTVIVTLDNPFALHPHSCL